MTLPQASHPGKVTLAPWKENQDLMQQKDTGSGSDKMEFPPIAAGALAGESENMQRQLQSIREHECLLDHFLDLLYCQNNELLEGDTWSRWMSVTTQDLTTRIPMYSQGTVIAIEAPAGTSLEVPDPDKDSVNAGGRTR